MVVGKAHEGNRRRLAESKGLANRVSPSSLATLSCFVGRPKRGEADLLIPQGLLAKLLRRTGEGLLNLKGLLTVLPPRGRATSSGFVGRLKRGEADLLIPQGLLAKLLRRTGEGVLNLKDLLTVFRRALGVYLKTGPVLRPLFFAESYQIPPFSAKNVQIIAENRAFRDRSYQKRVESCGSSQGTGQGFE